MLDVGGIPQGDYAPVPFVLSSRGWAAWIENDGHGVRCELGDEVILSTRAAAGPLKVHLFTHPTPAAQLRAFLRLTNSVPPVLPEWAYGFWKSRDIYRHQTEAEGEHAGFREHDIALDAIVLDSPWATQYNTWEFNPHQFPDAPGYVRRLREDGVRTVVWVTPWVNVDSREGQYPPDDASAALYRRAGAELRARAFRARRRWRAARRQVVDGHRDRPWTSPARPPSGGGVSRPSACWRWAWKASRPTTARAGTSRTTCGSPTAPAARRRRGGTG